MAFSLMSALQHLANDPWNFIFRIIQTILDLLLSPAPPPPDGKLGDRRIAIVGAGITGVSSAAHCVGHGFDVTIFESGGRKNLGGIWARVNNTSGLQIHSVMYRFHPSVQWNGGYPNRKQILGEVEKLWQRYGLEEKTRFETPVTKCEKNDEGKYIINDDPSLGEFDGVIACVGTCGDPKTAHIKGEERFKGDIYHSSELDGRDAKDKNVIVIGGGASAIEALEFATAAGAKKVHILARSEKWIIPRNPFINVLLALNIFGAETPLSWIPERLLRVFFYRDLKDIAPAANSGQGLFMETPMVNNDVLEQIRSGKAEWLRGDIKKFTPDGILFNHRSPGVPKGGPGREESIPGDVVIFATGYERPSLNFLPDGCFEKHYEPPNWYLQVFPPAHPDICANNCTYVNAIGSVGNYHIGIYTRFLLMYLSDPLARPSAQRMRLWIDFTKFIKSAAPTAAFDFFTYSELIYWFIFTIVVNPFRWKWAAFVLMGIGASLPKLIIRQEDRIRGLVGWDKSADLVDAAEKEDERLQKLQRKTVKPDDGKKDEKKKDEKDDHDDEEEDDEDDHEDHDEEENGHDDHKDDKSSQQQPKKSNSEKPKNNKKKSKGKPAKKA